MALSAFLMPAGYDRHAWQIEGSRAEEFGTYGIHEELAQEFERAMFDAVFIADTVGTNFIREHDLSMGNPYEPVTALASLAGVTSNIGLIGTISTTFNHPYTVARQLASIDVLSGGRAGWNIVTSSWGNLAYGMAELPPKEDRYRRADEFVKLARQLWGAWSDSAIIADRAAGHWADPDLIRPVHHHGEFFKVDGYLNIPRSPQGHPVLVQAGQSADGLNFGAEVAEVIYTVNPERENAIAYYKDQKARVASKGRNPEHVKILPGLIPYVGRTDKEGRDLLMAVVEHMDMEFVRKWFQDTNDIRVEDLKLDQPVPEERFDVHKTSTKGSRILAYRHYAMQDGITLRDVLINASSAMGHILMVGSVDTVAEQMIDWFESRACDGFSINTPSVPGSLRAICDLLIPALQERGYARREYQSSTLRGNLGLPYPEAWDVSEGRGDRIASAF
jgi:FMN-dependent oxidoreductase (nitrilotriacetate monooxygenase family)